MGHHVTISFSETEITESYYSQTHKTTVISKMEGNTCTYFCQRTAAHKKKELEKHKIDRPPGNFIMRNPQYYFHESTNKEMPYLQLQKHACDMKVGRCATLVYDHIFAVYHWCDRSQRDAKKVLRSEYGSDQFPTLTSSAMTWSFT